MNSVSVVMASLNSARTIGECLKTVREQEYDQSLVEILVADGGSSDGTRRSVAKYGGLVIPEQTGSPEAAKAVALKQARGEFVLFLASDNWLPDKQWLSLLVGCLAKEREAVGAYPWRYAYRHSDGSLNRYFALMGVNDPVAYYLGKADRQSYLSNKYELAGEVVGETERYWLVEFNGENMPTLGDNGFLVRREELMRARVSPGEFYHIDVCLDLVKQGKNRFGVVKTTVGHDTGESFFSFVGKRARYMRQLYLKDKTKRRYRWGERGEERKELFWYGVKAVTLVEPSLVAWRGTRRVNDWAWWWHPLVSLALAGAYSWEVAANWLRRLVGRATQERDI